MKQSLSLKLGQQLTMTPQLQQAIRLLQLSTLDLQMEVQQAIEANPLLELAEDDFDDDEVEAGADADSNTDNDTDALADDGEAITADDADAALDADGDETPADDYDTLVDPEPADPEAVNQAEDDWQEHIPEDLPVDSNWEDVYTPALPASGGAEDDNDIDGRNSASESLQDSLAWQLNLVPMSAIDRMIALLLIDSIDDDGLLGIELDDVLEALPPEADVELDEVEAVLRRIQQFEPAGVGARNLAECLALQLRAMPADEIDDPDVHARALRLVENHLDLLAAHDFRSLMRRMKIDDDELREAVELIRSLAPRPGASHDSARTEYIIPDVIVRKDNGRWIVELNPEGTPRVRVNSTYAGMVKRADTSADNQFIKNNLQEARWFIKSLQSRNETLLKVATRIVEHQRGFLDYGAEAMKPLVLHDIAEAVDMHESTISRVTTRKYMHTPRGVFELKYFFSSHVGTTSGGEVSSTAIRALLKKLIADEKPAKPLSDSKLAKLLGELDIKVARRTVAKYRESMHIPPSNERKRLV